MCACPLSSIGSHVVGTSRACGVRQAEPMSDPTARSWLATPTHTAWLEAHTRKLVRFAVGSALPAGGFAHQDVDGSPLPGRTPQLFLTARMAHASAIGVALGIPGAGSLLDQE